MNEDFTDAELEAYVDESLDPARTAEIERALQTDRGLLKRLSWINGRRDAGVHTLGEIWRQAQIGVPTRTEVADWLAGRLPPDQADYLKFRVDLLKCRFTTALVEDVRRTQDPSAAAPAAQRQRKIIQSGESLLNRRKRRS